MIRDRGIKQRTIVVFLIIFICVVAASLLISVYRGSRLTGKVLGKRALKAASQVYEVISADDVERIEMHLKQNSNDTRRLMQTPEYVRLQRSLAFYRKVLDLKYLYTMTKDNNGRYIYLVDGTDMNSKEFSTPGDIEDNTGFYGMFDAAMSGQVVNNDFSVDSKWGSLVSAYIPIKNTKGKVIAFLGADIDANEMIGVVKSNMLTTLLAVSVVLFAGIVAIWIFAIRLTDPIVKLRDYSLKVLNGEDVEPYEKIFNDEVGQLASVLNNRIDAIRNILDNTGEGLFTFGSGMRINREYSQECTRIFNLVKIENLDVAELIFPDDLEERTFMRQNLDRIFYERDITKRGAYISLLSKEIIINGSHIRLKYKMIKDVVSEQEIMMVILNDITEKRVLENKIKNEKDILDSVVKIMVNFNEFSYLVNNYFLFAAIELPEIMASKREACDILYDVYEKIHTFKGDFSIYGLEHIVTALHEFEQELSLQKDNLVSADALSFREYFRNKNMRAWLDKDMEELSRIMGVKLVDEISGSGSVVIIEEGKLEKVEQYARNSLHGEERENMLAQLAKLRYKPFRDMMKLYPDYIDQLANRLDKSVERLRIEGGSFLVDESIYRAFTDSLIHIFRNSIDHGIEQVEDRVQSGKPEAGSITCNIELDGKQLQITITDDGKGIDLANIKRIATEKHIISTRILDEMNEQELINLIFLEEFSTKDQLSDLSGRGIGLPAFKKELDKLGGRVVVSSQKGKWTSFQIRIPGVDSEVDQSMDS